jgi:hypothetical protein
MVSITLVESAKLCQDELISGVIDTIIDVNQFFQLVPFDGIEGNSLAYNRENVLGDVQTATVGDTITAKNAATVTQANSTLTTIIGDAEVNGLIEATRSGLNDQTAVQVASKAKSAGRQYQSMMLNGTGSGTQFPGMLVLCDAGRTIASTGANGDALGFGALDQLIDTVTDKDGQVDYIVMNSRTVRSYKALLRGLGGNSVDDMYELPSGTKVNAYSGVPIFRNDWMPINQTRGATVTCTSVIAGTFDDGSRKHGIAGLTAANAAGVQVDYVGVHQTRDEKIYRVKWYVGFALFNLNGMAMLTGITN